MTAIEETLSARAEVVSTEKNVQACQITMNYIDTKIYEIYITSLLFFYILSIESRSC